MKADNYDNKLFEHIKNLDYPRMSGSEGEKKAVKYISSVFVNYGYKPIKEEFGYLLSSSFRKIFIVIVFTGYLTLSLINLLYWDNIIICNWC